MAFRGPIKDIVSIYLCYKVLAIWIFKAEMSSNVGIAAFVVFGLSIWFMLERVGIIPKL